MQIVNQKMAKKYLAKLNKDLLKAEKKLQSLFEEQERIASQHKICPACLGEKQLVLAGREVTCPRCNGLGTYVKGKA